MNELEMEKVAGAIGSLVNANPRSLLVECARRKHEAVTQGGTI